MSYVLAHWSPVWWVLAIWVAVVAVHLVGLGRIRREDLGRRELAWRAAAFHGGLLAVLLALVSPLAYWSLTFIWVRSIQDLLLALVAPALIAGGAPGRPLASGLRRPAGSVAHPADALDRPPAPPRARWWLAWPVAITVAFNVVWLGGHVPALYDLAATNPAVRYAQYVTYLGAGILFWLQLIGSGGPSPAAAPMRRLALLVGTAAADTVLGMVLVFGSGLLYPAYRGAGHHQLSVVADQQVGGAVLWVGMLPPLIIASMALLLGWLEHEESDELSRELDRLTGQTPVAGSPPLAGRPTWAGSGRARPGKAAWPTRPGYRRPTI